MALVTEAGVKSDLCQGQVRPGLQGLLGPLEAVTAMSPLQYQERLLLQKAGGL